MDPELEILDKLLTDGAKIVCDNKKVILLEPEATDSKITISQIPDDAIIIKCDQFKAPKSIFKGNSGECKRCDYILLFSYQSKNYALFIEMKRGNRSSSAIKQQLIGGRCFLDYCCAILKHFHNVKKPFVGYNSRYVCFTKTFIDKRPTKQERSKTRSVHMKPEKFLKLSSERYVPLGKLL